MVMHIALATDNKYAAHCATTIASILQNHEHTKSIAFHVLHSDLSEANKTKLELTVYDLSFYHSTIEFVDMSDLDISKFPMNRPHISIATYYRLFLQDVLPDVDKVLYLDCDLLVVSDLTRLYDTPMCNNLVIASLDETDNYHRKRLKVRKYFNAGVSLLNLKALREEHFLRVYLETFRENEDKIECQDQDIMNLAFNRRVKITSLKYNANSTIFHNDIFTDASYSVAEERRVRSNPAIIHFTGEHKPWQFTCCHPLKWEYLHYLRYTYYELEMYKQIFFYLLSFIFKIDKTFKLFCIKLFGLEVFKIHGNTHKKTYFLGIRIK